jgi:hypothetical protein
MLVGVSISRVNREMVFRPFFVVFPIKPEEKAVLARAPAIAEKALITPQSGVLPSRKADFGPPQGRPLKRPAFRMGE